MQADLLAQVRGDLQREVLAGGVHDAAAARDWRKTHKFEIRQPDTRRRRLTDQGFPGAAGCRCGPHLPLSAQSGTICPVRRRYCTTVRAPHLRLP
jgi:uncharacterized protein YbjT (DUF2867 family)